MRDPKALPMSRWISNGLFYVERDLLGTSIIWLGINEMTGGPATMHRIKNRHAPDRNSERAVREWAADQGINLEN